MRLHEHLGIGRLPFAKRELSQATVLDNTGILGVFRRITVQEEPDNRRSRCYTLSSKFFYLGDSQGQIAAANVGEGDHIRGSVRSLPVSSQDKPHRII